MLLQKTLSLSEAQFKFSADSGVFKGYASVWDGVDSYGDTIKKGAYLETLKDHGVPKMFFDHKWDMPVGKYTHVDEDSRGLWVEGELTPAHSRAADVKAAMLHQTLDGLSVGGMLHTGDFKTNAQGGRIIHKWSKLVEISPVVFPADGRARIESVKGEEIIQEIDSIESIRDFESFLRDAGGLSKGAVLALTVRAKAIFGRGEPDEVAEAKALAEIAERINRRTALLAGA